MVYPVQRPKFLIDADKSRKVLKKKKDEVITVFPLHEKDPLFCVVISFRW